MSGQVSNTRNRAGWAPRPIARRRFGTLPIIQSGPAVAELKHNRRVRF